MVDSETITSKQLDEFVRLSDSVGGPFSPGFSERWARFSYQPSTRVDQDLDPYSQEYMNNQLDLYRELSGRSIDQTANEHTQFEIEPLINAHNAMNSHASDVLAREYFQISSATLLARLPAQPRILDMGSGWGITSEFFALLGAKVTAVDINADFVELLRRRANRLKYDIDVVCSSFEEFVTSSVFDGIFFFQCFHHAIKPWELIGRLANFLRPDGKFMLAGEPVQNHWWKSWGLRLDPTSIYCIRKFGWFESGWSEPFLIDMFNRAGFWVNYKPQEDQQSPIIVAERRKTLFSADIQQGCIGWIREADYLVSQGNCFLHLNAPKYASEMILTIFNFRPKVINLNIVSDDKLVTSIILDCGENKVRLKNVMKPTTYQFASEKWKPSIETGSADNRLISFHLHSIDFA